MPRQVARSTRSASSPRFGAYSSAAARDQVVESRNRPRPWFFHRDSWRTVTRSRAPGTAGSASASGRTRTLGAPDVPRTTQYDAGSRSIARRALASSARVAHAVAKRSGVHAAVGAARKSSSTSVTQKFEFAWRPAPPCGSDA